MNCKRHKGGHRGVSFNCRGTGENPGQDSQPTKTPSAKDDDSHDAQVWTVPAGRPGKEDGGKIGRCHGTSHNYGQVWSANCRWRVVDFLFLQTWITIPSKYILEVTSCYSSRSFVLPSSLAVSSGQGTDVSEEPAAVTFIVIAVPVHTGLRY